MELTITCDNHENMDSRDLRRLTERVTSKMADGELVPFKFDVITPDDEFTASVAVTKTTVPQKPKDRMNRHFSIFNCHVNGAKDKADAEFIEQFGQGAFDEQIAPLHESGIMEILNRTDDSYVAFCYGAWIALCTMFVNEDRS